MIQASKLKMIYGEEIAYKVINSKILVIGAGGIGCELVKTLSVTGRFDLVINALDNIEARNYVNQICYNLDIPLIEAGTNGYVATCVDKPKDQSFPVCTIRQKPEKLIHCIVWAKALFDGLFGSRDQSDHIIDYLPEPIQDQSADFFDYAKQVFSKLFDEEVKNQIQAVKSKLMAQTLNPDEKQSEESFLKKINVLEFSNHEESIQRDLTDREYKLNKPELNDENNLTILTLQEQIYTFVQSILKIYQERFDKIGQMTFDKDDDSIIDLVSSATNLRAYNFSVAMESKFKIKEMAGKIIPAISSSNALVASLQVFEAIKILAGQFENLQGIYYRRLDTKKLQSFKRINDPKNPNLIDEVLIRDIQLGDEFQMAFDTFQYEQFSDLDEDEEIMNKKKLIRTLSELNVTDNSIIQVQGDFKSQTENNQSSVIYVLLCECPEQEETLKTVLLKKGINQPLFDNTMEISEGEVEIQNDQKFTEAIIKPQTIIGKRLHSEIEIGNQVDIDETKNSDSNKRAKIDEQIEV
ncbi:sumo-activating enzyme subunit 2 [Stylonychia lemnae]|uniref:Sumo-activating enzyme subunit 2 n=1 Tax=Stylonychia lemnae TaxID=5949 RepID=A0A077ZTP0_STYLE|nr:sumo-activating enzyme subunit 2 [Stylonychia lemnae]|eukprot:CDW72705.1 sumo-activating enzyme subunit 2 [Stylonychia lemnae]